MRRVKHFYFALLIALLLSTTLPRLSSAQDYSKATIDIGMVVANAEKSVAFYTDALGFKEVKGFSVPGDYCAEVGLTSGKGIDVRVLVLGEGKQATNLKLIEIPGVESKKSDNTNIHSQLGFRYLTLHTADTEAAVARLKKAGVATVAATPKALPAGMPQDMSLTIVRDPDGNLVELVGPTKKK